MVTANHPDGCWCLACACDDPYPSHPTPVEKAIVTANAVIWLSVALTAVAVLRERSAGAVLACFVAIGAVVAWTEWRHL